MTYKRATVSKSFIKTAKMYRAIVSMVDNGASMEQINKKIKELELQIIRNGEDIKTLQDGSGTLVKDWILDITENGYLRLTTNQENIDSYSVTEDGYLLLTL